MRPKRQGSRITLCRTAAPQPAQLRRYTGSALALVQITTRPTRASTARHCDMGFGFPRTEPAYHHTDVHRSSVRTLPALVPFARSLGSGETSGCRQTLKPQIANETALAKPNGMTHKRLDHRGFSFVLAGRNTALYGANAGRRRRRARRAWTPWRAARGSNLDHAGTAASGTA
jgi:hypothetical protein